MKKQILFVQGGGAGTHDEWDKKLVDSLARELGPGYDIRYPRMPEEADPSFVGWKTALAGEVAKLDDGAMLVGHSIGGTILIAALAEAAPGRVLCGVFLVAAPFVGTGGWPGEDIRMMDDLGVRLPPDTPIFLYHGSEDDTAPIAHVELYERAISGAVVRRLHGRDHQLNNDLAVLADDVRTLTEGGRP